MSYVAEKIKLDKKSFLSIAGKEGIDLGLFDVCDELDSITLSIDDYSLCIRYTYSGMCDVVRSIVFRDGDDMDYYPEYKELFSRSLFLGQIYGLFKEYLTSPGVISDVTMDEDGEVNASFVVPTIFQSLFYLNPPFYIHLFFDIISNTLEGKKWGLDFNTYDYDFQETFDREGDRTMLFVEIKKSGGD